eukprot:1195366-Prorocentrum_minimum.AAC.1
MSVSSPTIGRSRAAAAEGRRRRSARSQTTSAAAAAGSGFPARYTGSAVQTNEPKSRNANTAHGDRPEPLTWRNIPTPAATSAAAGGQAPQPACAPNERRTRERDAAAKEPTTYAAFCASFVQSRGSCWLWL